MGNQRSIVPPPEFIGTASDVEDGDLTAAAGFLSRMFSAMGDTVTVDTRDDEVVLNQEGLRIVRDMSGGERAVLLHCWEQLWVGAMQSNQRRKVLSARTSADGLKWTLRYSPQR